MTVAAYDPRWPRMFEREAARIREATDDVLTAVEHVGSTAVPGLAAKAIIDILAGVRRLADADRCIAPLEGVGYDYVPAYEEFIPARRYLRKGPPDTRTHHLHVVEEGGAFWQETLAFRDALRLRPDLARAYEDLKHRLARRWSQDSWAYTEAKAPFIRSVLAETRTSHEGG